MSSGSIHDTIATVHPLPHHPSAYQYDEREIGTDGVALSPYDPQWEQTYNQMLVESLPLFAKDVLGMELAPHIMDWGDLVVEESRIGVLAARDHGKSAFFSYAYPIWRAWGDPGCEVYLFSRSENQAREFLEIIMWGRNNLTGIAGCAALSDLIPSREAMRKDPRLRITRTDVVLSNGSRIRVVGYGTGIRGRHPKYAVLDDVLNDNDMWSETERKKHISYYQSAIVNLIMPTTQHDGWFEGGQCIVIGCVTEDTWVPTADGLKQIGDLRPGPRVPATMHDLGVRVAGRNGLQEASHFWDNGVCQTKRITLESGVKLEGSLRHPVLVMSEDGVPEWKRFPDIKVGDFVASRIGTESWGAAPEGMGQDDAYLMGLWCAEGSVELPYRLTIASANEEIHEFLLNREEKWKPTRGGTHWRCSSKSVIEQWESWGMKWGLSGTKRVPKSIMSGSRENAVAWLQGYLDGDGNAYARGNCAQVAVGSVSEGLINDVQVLLLNLGIDANQWTKPYRPSKIAPVGRELHMLRALGDDARQLMSFGFRLSRKRRDVELVGTCRKIPHQRKLLRRLMDTKPALARTRGKARRKPPSNMTEVMGCTASSTKVLTGIVDWYEGHGSEADACEKIRRNVAEGFLWKRVSKVEDGEAYTVDFVVPDGHSFVSNGIVSHNTPYHALDLLGWLEKNEVYSFHKYPGIITDPNTGEESALFPWRWRLDQLKRKKQEIGSVAFSREILCSPITDDIAIFPSYLFPPLYDNVLTLRPTRQEIRQRGWDIFFGVDIARSASVGADYFVIFVLAKDREGTRYIVDIHRSRGLAFRTQLETLGELAKRYDPSLVLIESNAMQQIYTDEMRRMTDIPVKPFVTSAANKYPLDKGVPGLRIILENQKLVIPKGDEYSRITTSTWEGECSQFGFVDGKLQGIGAHDDTVMAWWLCNEAIKLGGFSFAFGDEDASAGGSFDDIDDDNGESFEDILMGPKEEREDDKDESFF